MSLETEMGVFIHGSQHPAQMELYIEGLIRDMEVSWIIVWKFEKRNNEPSRNIHDFLCAKSA